MVFPLFCSTLLLVLIYKFLYSFVLLRSCTGPVPAAQNSSPHFYRCSHASCFLTPISIFKLEFPWLLLIPDPGQTLAANCTMVVCYGSCILYVPALYLIQIQYVGLPCFYPKWSQLKLIFFYILTKKNKNLLFRSKCSPPLPLIRKVFEPQVATLTFSHH